jgi:hypothetical protein
MPMLPIAHLALLAYRGNGEYVLAVAMSELGSDFKVRCTWRPSGTKKDQPKRSWTRRWLVKRSPGGETYRLNAAVTAWTLTAQAVSVVIA